MIELLTVLENAELVNCMDENPRYYSGALLLSPQYSRSYEDRIVWENTDIENSLSGTVMRKSRTMWVKTFLEYRNQIISLKF